MGAGMASGRGPAQVWRPVDPDRGGSAWAHFLSRRLNVSSAMAWKSVVSSPEISSRAGRHRGSPRSVRSGTPAPSGRGAGPPCGRAGPRGPWAPPGECTPGGRSFQGESEPGIRSGSGKRCALDGDARSRISPARNMVCAVPPSSSPGANQRLSSAGGQSWPRCCPEDDSGSGAIRRIAISMVVADDDEDVLRAGACRSGGRRSAACGRRG